MDVIVTDLTVLPMTEAIIFGVAEPHATRLARAIEDHNAMTCTVTADLHGLGAQSWIITVPGSAVRLIDAGVDPQRLALLWGDKPLDATANRWEQQGITVLPGTMPGCVLDWLNTQAGSALVWDDETPGELRWAEDAPPSGTGVRGGHRPSSATRGMTLAVYSSGGGVGKTTTAVYLATIASRHRIDTGLIELDENRSGMLTYWDRTVRHGGLDSVKPGDWSDPQRLAATLSQMVVPVAPHLAALAIEGTPEGLQYHREQAESDLNHLYTWAQRRWGLTIYDLPATIRDYSVLHTLQTVDAILFVIEPTAIMYESSLRYLNIIQSLGSMGQDIIRKTGLVVNKIPKSRQARLDPAVLGDTLGLPLWGQISEQTQRYMAGINHHRITPTAEWDKLWTALPMNRDATPAADRPRRRLSLFHRKEGSR